MRSSVMSAVPRPDATHLLAGGGATGELLRATDWSATPLGPIESWPLSLKTIVGTLLHSRHPMFLWWGPELIQIYNDAYVPSFGRGKHPVAMGQRGRECWGEIWPIIWPQINDVMQHAKSSWNEDALVPIFRNGRIEDVYWTYGYSPVFDDEGRVGGTLVVCTETTGRVVAERRVEALRSFAQRISGTTDAGAVFDIAIDCARAASADIAFMVPYRIDAATGEPSRIASAHAAREPVVGLDAAVREHCLGDRAAATALPHELELVSDANAKVRAFVVPRANANATGSSDVLVFGLSSRLPFDDAYRSFLVQFVAQIDRALATADMLSIRAALDSERRNLLLQAPVATALLTGPNHVFELVNARYQQMVGDRPLVGKTYVEAFPELVGGPLPGILDRVYQYGEPFVAPESLLRLDCDGDGLLEDCYFRFNLEPIRNERGQVFGMMAVAIDITEQVTARHVLEKATLEREKLLERLEAANQAKDEFLATVSHELRTPLTAILGWARLLRESKDPSRVTKGLAVIERNAAAQAQLIEDILDVSRIISGKVRMNMRRVEPAAVVRAAVETVRPSAAGRSIKLRVDVDPALRTLVADEDRLQQVVWNLLSNAVKFTPQGGEVVVTAKSIDAHVVIEVTDSGKGISPEFLPHVFDRFRQADNTTTKQHGGLGLGLAIVRQLVELHGGTVSARSEGEGRGATFEVRLPMRALELELDRTYESEAPPSVATGRAQKARHLADVHVLLVDDQHDARELAATVLEDAGAHVTQATSVEAAMRVLESTRVDVIVSDVGMPGEDGYTFLQRVRSGAGPAATRDLPALALTAYARAEDRSRALAAGFQKHLAKPSDPVELVSSIARLARR